MSEPYAGPQFAGMDLHRRRSVLVRTTQSGGLPETVRIVNDAERLAASGRRIAQKGDTGDA